MKIGIIATAILAASLASPAQQPPPHADSSLILKKDHVLQLLSGGKVIRTYKVALGTGGLASKQREGDAPHPKGTTSSTAATPAANITRRCTSPTPTPTTASAPRASASRPAERS